MPYPQDMVYVRWEFQWKNTEEIQTLGMWGVVTQEGSGAFPDWQPTVQAIAEKGVSAWAESWEAAKFPLQVVGTRCIAYHYSQDHKDPLDRGEAAFDGEDAWAGTANVAMPPQLSVVCSLYGYEPGSFVQQRARKRGRVYLPTPGTAQLDGTGRLSESVAGQWLTDATAWMNAMTGTLDVEGDPVASAPHWRPYVSSTAGQIATKVTHLRVGTVVDTQRRRRNQLPEVYVSGPINL